MSTKYDTYLDMLVHPGGRGNTNSPLVAVTTVVLTSAPSVSGPPPLHHSLLPGPTVTTLACLGRQVIPSARMEALMQHYQAAGFLKEVSRLTASPRRPSSNRMCDDGWLRFAYWAPVQRIDPFGPQLLK